ncbi:MAG: fluoride efflux transporter FluC, partial [Miltoncostaeaceae bacterium]
VARYSTGRLVMAVSGRGAPWGVLTVNLLGAFMLGVLSGAGPARGVLLVAGAGFLGAYTTFSTWMIETEGMAEQGRISAALLNVVGPLIGGIGLAAAGFALGAALGGS